VKRALGSDLTLTADAAAVAGCRDALGTERSACSRRATLLE
jgi:hypothetical protein